MSDPGASAAYRGYRLQVLYTLKRIFNPGLGESYFFHPEGYEDLDIEREDGTLVETIQVKSYNNLVLSDLTPDRENNFFRRALLHFQTQNPPVVKLINFGPISDELRFAWKKDGKHRQRVYNKLNDLSYTKDEIEILFNRVELSEHIESIETEEVFTQLREQLTGINPARAFELLNFWLYKQSENRTRITKQDLIQRIQDIGRFLIERYQFHQEWFTSIQPIEDIQVDEERLRKLRQEFYIGISARYEHVLADLDFRRDEKMAEISNAFGRTNVVIIHAASGQGKSTIAYRYLHENYPDQWRFSIELIENRQHALRIARALSGHAKAVQAPMAIFIDVAPTDLDWPVLVRQLAHEPYFQILVTIREEDFRRSNISNAFEYTSVNLSFSKTEARKIFERARNAGHAQEYLSFDDAWHVFGGDGPLMEFVYLLTQTQTLRNRLEEQIYRIRQKVQEMKLSPDELELLRLVSTAAAYDARIHLPSLLGQVNLPDPGLTLNSFEEEYLLKVSPDNQYITGLHPIRSQILVDLLTDPVIYPWLQAVKRSAKFIPEDDWEIFFLQSLVYRQNDFCQILDLLNTLKPTSWTGTVGILRCLLWSGIKLYVDENRETAEAAHNLFGPGWHFIMDLNFAGDEAPDLEGWWKNLGDLIPGDRQGEIERIRHGQTLKERIYQFAKAWLDLQETSPNPPSSTKDWTSAAEVLYWAARFGKANNVHDWITDELLSSSLHKLSIEKLAEISYALHLVNSDRTLAWRQAHRTDLEGILAKELGIVAIEEVSDTLTIHFLTYPENTPIQDSEGEGKQKSLHDQTIERLQIVRLLYPYFTKYGAQGYGHQIPGLGIDRHDDTHKTGVSREHLPPHWPIWVNGIATGLIQNRFRPDNWLEYFQEIIRLRQGIISCFSDLVRGVSLYFNRDKALNLLRIEVISNGTWDRIKSSANERPLLPKLAADIWGMTQPESDAQRLAKVIEEELSAYIAEQIKPYLEFERKYFTGIFNFMEQSLHVMIVNFHSGKLPAESPEKRTVLETLRKSNIKTDMQFLSFYNLSEAKSALNCYQDNFRALFNDIINFNELEQLETSERDTINLLWMLWYYFTNSPWTPYANAKKQVPARINAIQLHLVKKYDDVLLQFQKGGIQAIRLETDLLWESSSTVWIKLDLESPIQMYQIMDSLIFALRSAIGPAEYASIAYSLIETYLKYTVILPMVRGKTVSSFIWPLRTVYAIATNEPMENKLWAYVPQQASEELLTRLGVSCWVNKDIVLANQLSDSVKGLALMTSLVGRLNAMPTSTEVGSELLQLFMRKRSEEMSELLQKFLNAGTALLDKYNSFSEDEKNRHPLMTEAINILIEIHKKVLPLEDSNSRPSLDLEGVLNYSERLQNIYNQVENAKLFWIADSIYDQ